MAVMVVEIQLLEKVVRYGSKSGRIPVVRDHFSENGRQR
jgi:hypothetical protein